MMPALFLVLAVSFFISLSRIVSLSLRCVTNMAQAFQMAENMFILESRRCRTTNDLKNEATCLCCVVCVVLCLCVFQRELLILTTIEGGWHLSRATGRGGVSVVSH